MPSRPSTTEDHESAVERAQMALDSARVLLRDSRRTDTRAVRIMRALDSASLLIDRAVRSDEP